MIPSAFIDPAVAGGVLLTGGMLAWMLRQQTLDVTLDAEGLSCGPRRVPFEQVRRLVYVRGGHGAFFRVGTPFGVIAFRDEQLAQHPDNARDAIVRAAGLVPAPLEHLGREMATLPGDRVQEWALPELAAAAQAELDAELEAEREAEAPADSGSTARKAGVGLAALAALALKFGKLVPLALKSLAGLLKLGNVLPTAVSMAVTVWAYAQIWGWWFALGFVLLILVHELGHAAVMKAKGLRTSPIVFVPFVGALIAVKDQFRDALVESETAYGGPAAGALAATACFVGWRLTGHEFLLNLSYLGFLLNLFNLLPVSPLDGGRIVTAVSPALWLVGLVAAGALAFRSGHPLLMVIAVLGALRAWRTWRSRGADQPAAYFEVPARARALMALAYFGLCAYLGVMTMVAVELGNAAV